MQEDGDLVIQLDAARAGDGDATEPLFQVLLPEVRAYVRLHSGRSIRERESITDVV